jgi:hypothetical protein
MEEGGGESEEGGGDVGRCPAPSCCARTRCGEAARSQARPTGTASPAG